MKNIEINITTQGAESLVIPISHFNMTENEWDNLSEKTKSAKIKDFIEERIWDLAENPNWQIDGFNKTSKKLNFNYILCFPNNIDVKYEK